MSDGAVAKETCEHFWAWVSPAGTSQGAELCMTCHQPNPRWLNRTIQLRKGSFLADALRVWRER